MFGGKMRHTLKQAGKKINCGKRLNKNSLGVKLEFLLCRFLRDRRCFREKTAGLTNLEKMSKLAACGKQRMPPALKEEPLLDMRVKAKMSVSCVTERGRGHWSSEPFLERVAGITWDYPSWLEDWGLGRTRICNMHRVTQFVLPFLSRALKLRLNIYGDLCEQMWHYLMFLLSLLCFSGSAERQLSAGGVPDPTSTGALLDPTETFFFPHTDALTWSHSVRVAIEMTRNHVFCHRISCRLRDLLTVLSWV